MAHATGRTKAGRGRFYMDCASATVTGRGTAHGVAKDAKTDLAPQRLDAEPAAPLAPAVFRTMPLQLGEAVYVLGFPLCGRARQRGEFYQRPRQFRGRHG